MIIKGRLNMVEELINSIKNAEIKAENDVNDSVKQAREIMRVAGDRASAISREADDFIEAKIKDANDEGKQLAEEEYSKVMFDAHKQCSEIEEVAKANSAKAVEFVAEGLYKKYGSR